MRKAIPVSSWMSGERAPTTGSSSRSTITRPPNSGCSEAPTRPPTPQLVGAREAGLQYDLEEGGDVFFILTNADGAKDFKIVTAPVSDPTRPNWTDLVPHESGRLILSILAFKDFLVRLERKDGLPRIIVRDRATGEEHGISFDEEAYSLSLLGSYEYDTEIMRFSYSSMTTPAQVLDYDMRTRERTLLKTRKFPRATTPITMSRAG